MHDHDDPKHCTICRKALEAVESYGDILNFKPGGSIEASVQQYLDAFDWASAVSEGARA
jgi:hypothetical protein